MNVKPSSASEYNAQQIGLVHSVCLYISTILGDYMDDVVIVGGLVPSLIIPQAPLPPGAEAHAGTQDLDIGFSLGVLDSERYQEIAERLRGAGFTPDVNENQNPTFQRWKLERSVKITVDFLIPQSGKDEIGGSIKHFTNEFGAVITPGLELAFEYRIRVSITGQTPFGESAARNIWVCGPGAFIILKALAFNSRGENKDAYDLFYVVRNFGSGYRENLEHLRPILRNEHGRKAIGILNRDFSAPGLVGPARVARFLFGRLDEETQVEAAGFIKQILDRLEL